MFCYIDFFRFYFFYSKRPSKEHGYKMGERRLGSGGRVFGPNDLQICRAIDGRMETAQEYVKKVRLLL